MSEPNATAINTFFTSLPSIALYSRSFRLAPNRLALEYSITQYRCLHTCGLFYRVAEKISGTFSPEIGKAEPRLLDSDALLFYPVLRTYLKITF
jgi:hypothetical protein